MKAGSRRDDKKTRRSCVTLYYTRRLVFPNTVYYVVSDLFKLFVASHSSIKTIGHI